MTPDDLAFAQTGGHTSLSSERLIICVPKELLLFLLFIYYLEFCKAMCVKLSKVLMAPCMAPPDSVVI